MADPADLVGFVGFGAQVSCSRCQGPRFFVFVIADDFEVICVECGTKMRRRRDDDARSRP